VHIGLLSQFEIALENFTNDNRAALLHNSSSFNGEPQGQVYFAGEHASDLSGWREGAV
jgi:hypothetical protein